MKSTGIVRNIDSLGRIVLPIELDGEHIDRPFVDSVHRDLHGRHVHRAAQARAQLRFLRQL